MGAARMAAPAVTLLLLLLHLARADAAGPDDEAAALLAFKRARRLGPGQLQLSVAVRMVRCLVCGRPRPGTQPQRHVAYWPAPPRRHARAP
jgi:hypothetical protein